MSVLTPTQLPDPPLAPTPDAPVPPPTQYAAWERAVPVPRPLGALACLCLHLPLPLTLTYAMVFLFGQFQRETARGGVSDVLVLAGVTGATVISVGVALAATARRLENRVRRRIRIGLAASCLVSVVAIAAVTPKPADTGPTARTNVAEQGMKAARHLEVGHAAQ